MPKRKNYFEEHIKRRTDPNDLSRFTVDYDRYDRQDAQKLLDELKEFAAHRDKLADSKAGDLAYDVWQDLLLSFKKVDPQLLPPNEVRPTHLINHMVMEEAQNLPDHKELRTWTQGDDIGAALACNTIEPDMETLYDKMDEQIKQAQEFEKMLQELAAQNQEQRDLEALHQEWTEENDPNDPKNQKEATDWSEKMKDMQKRIDEAAAKAQAAGQELQDGIDGMRPEARGAMKKGMKQAAEDAENASAMCDSWGLEPGQLQRLPAQERMELARKFNTAKFRRIAEIFGPMKRYAMTQQRRKVNYAPEEIYDVELGDDIPKILPSELAKLTDEDTELLFLKDFSEKNIPMYKMRGYEKIAKGGIIFCHDGSGSMSGDREIWAKAVGLCLLHIARKQKRSFWAIQFGSPGQIRIDDFTDSQNITPEQVLDFAEFFFGGGTDFMTPLNKAVELLEEENNRTGGVKSDIVFASDGQCGITDEWAAEFEKAREKLRFRCWGINIGGNPQDEPMYAICEGLVSTIQSLTHGENIEAIFGGV